MIFYTTNILVLPLLIAVSVADAYLWIVTARVLYSRIPCVKEKPFSQGLKLLADGLPSRIDAWLGRRIGQPVRRWVPWAAAIIGVFLLRYALIGIAVAIS